MPKKINILHIIDKFSMDGIHPSSCTKLLVEWIAKHDLTRFNVMVAGLQKDGGSRLLEDNGIKVFYIERGKISPAIVNEIIKLIEQEHIDLIHLHGYGAANFGRIAARKTGIANVVHEHAILKVLPHQFVVDFLLRNKTDKAVAVAEAVKLFMIKGRSIPEQKINVIWNGVRIDNFRNISKERIDRVKHEIGIDNGKKIVGTLTRLRKEKGNQYLIEAAASVLKENPETQFIIAGDGPLKSELKRLTDSLELNGQVIFPGFVNDIAALLTTFDIVVMPSLTEGAPLALLEYMAAGKAIVATKVGGIIEVLKDHESGLLVPAADKDALAEAISSLLDDEQLASEIAGNAAKESDKYSIENNVRALENLYKQLVSNGLNRES